MAEKSTCSRQRSHGWWIVSLLFVVIYMTIPNRAALASETEVYRSVDADGTAVFSDQPKVSRPLASDARRVRTRPKAGNVTPPGVMAKKFEKIPQLLEKAIKSYCTYDLATLKTITLPSYWRTAEHEITFVNSSDNDAGRSFLRSHCFEWFKIEDVRGFYGRMAGTEDIRRPLAELMVRAWRQGDPPDGYGYHITFVQDKGDWMYYNIVNGPIGLPAMGR